MTPLASALALLLSSNPPLPPPVPAAPPAARVDSRDDADEDVDDGPVDVALHVGKDDGGATLVNGHVRVFGLDGGRSTTIAIGPAGVRIDGGRPRHHHHGGGEDSSRVGTGNITVHAGERVRDTVAIGGSVELEPGAVAKDVVAVGGSIKAGDGAVIQGDAVAVGGSVDLAGNASVTGSAVAIGGSVDQAAGSEIGGDHVSLGFPGLGTMFAVGAGLVGLGALSPLWLFGSVLAKLVVFLAVGLLLLALWPRRLEHLADELWRIPGRSILLGTLSLLAIPLFTLLLVVTLIGIPLVPVELLALALMTTMGFSALALALGRRLPFGRGRSAVQLAVGCLLLLVIFAVPFLGWLAMCACWLWVFGAVAATRFGREPPLPPPPAA